MAIQKILTDLEVSGAVTIDSATDTILKLNSTDNGALYVNYARSDDRHAYVGFGGASDNFTIMSEEVGGQLILGTAATTRMTIDETGNVGIGTDTPDVMLDVSTTTYANTFVPIQDLKYTTFDVLKLGFTGLTGSIRAGTIDTGTYGFAINTGDGTERMRIDASGNVGIGTIAPDSKLHVWASNSGVATPTGTLVVEKGSAPSIQILSANTQTQSINFGDPEDGDAGSVKYSHSSNEMTFKTNGGDRVFINSLGKVGINQATPVASVDIVETSLPTTGTSYGVLLDSEKDSSTTAYTVSSFGLRSYVRSVNTGTNQITDLNALWTKAEHTGTGPTYFLIGSTNRGVHNGSGNTNVIYGNFAEAQIIGTGVGTHNYLVGGYSKSTINNANATLTNSITHYIKGAVTAGTVAEVSGIVLDLDMTGGTVSGDVQYIKILNDAITTPVTGTSRAINSLSVLPSTFAGKITVGASTVPVVTLNVAGCVRIADDSTAASATTVGAMRYREAGTFSYFDMVMRTVAGYEWVNVVRNDFNV